MFDRKARETRLLEVLLAAFPDRGRETWSAVRKRRCLHLARRSGRGAALADVRRALEASGADDAEDLLLWAERNTLRTCTTRMELCLAGTARSPRAPPPCVAPLLLRIIENVGEDLRVAAIDPARVVATLQRETELAATFVLWLAGWHVPFCHHAAGAAIDPIPGTDWRVVLHTAVTASTDAAMRLAKQRPGKARQAFESSLAAFGGPLDRARKVLSLDRADRDALSTLARRGRKALAIAAGRSTVVVRSDPKRTLLFTLGIEP